MQDTFEAHGESLGKDEVRLTKRAYGWPEDAQFFVPPEAQREFRKGRRARDGAAQRLAASHARLSRRAAGAGRRLGPVVMAEYGFTVANVVATAKSLLARRRA